MTDKAAHLMQHVDLDRPEMAAVRSAADPVGAFLAHIVAPGRARYRFEWQKKAEIVDFLRRNYQAWREFDTAPARRLAALTIQEAQGPRALAEIAILGRAWWATGDPAWGEAFQRFYTAVPTGEMFNWDSFNGTQADLDLEAFLLLSDCPGFSRNGRVAVLDHLRVIRDNAWDTHTSRWHPLMLGPEGHNWYLHGVHGLPAMAMLLPEFKRSAHLLKASWSMIEEHLRGHYKADGGARETAPGYQVGSLMNLWEFYLLARRNGQPMSEGFLDRLMRATRFILNLLTPLGSLPSYGDDGSYQPGCMTNLAAVAAAATGDRVCKWYAEYCRVLREGVAGEAPGELPQSAFWQVGLEGAAVYSQTRTRNPHATSILLGPTGYAAMRGGEGVKDNFLSIAAATRGPIVTSHGHNDVFSIEAHAGGVRFLGEMGCAPYGNTPGRLYDISTEAHSCLTIDGREQAEIADEWRWRSHVVPCVRRWISEDTHDFFHGVHEGFYRYQRHDTLHARKVLFIKPAAGRSYWVVMDWLGSACQNDYRAYFHGVTPMTVRSAAGQGPAAGKAPAKGCSAVLEDGGMRLAIVPPAEDELVAAEVHSDGLKAYIRERNLDERRYTCVSFGRRGDNDCLVWVLAPLTAGENLPRVRRLPAATDGQPADAHAATAVEIAFDDCTDALCLSHKDYDAALSFGTHNAWGFLAFRRADAAGRESFAFTHTMEDGIVGR